MTNYISIRQVMDNILRHPLLLDLLLETAVNYAVEFIRIVGMPQVYTDKSASLSLIDYRCMLPCDFQEVIQATDDKGHSYRYTTDTFHINRNGDKQGELTYKILNNIFFSNKETGEVLLSYRAIDVDDDGFPLIPDNSSFIKALEFYIKQNWFNILFDLGKISLASLLVALLNYAWYVGLALSDLIRPSIDQMESFTNMWNQLLSKTNEHNKQFLNTGSREYIKVH